VPRRRELGPGALSLALNVPALVLIAGIIAYPLAYALYLAFHRVTVRELRTGERPFVGLLNFRRLLEDDVFWLSLQHTLQFAVVVVAAEVLLGLAIALLLARSRGPLTAATRLLMLLPWAVPPIANALLWSFVYNSKYGVLNAVLYRLAFIDRPVSWLGDPDLALYAVAAAYVWRTTPFAVLLIHAALEGIPRPLWEASAIDGASAWRQLRHVILPLLAPVLMIVTILRTTWAFQAFEEIFGMTGGGPGNATWVASYYSYRYAFQPPHDVGLGAASAFVLACVIGVFAVLYIVVMRRTQVEWE
jgi:multiple sugar transport system permease protein